MPVSRSPVSPSISSAHFLILLPSLNPLQWVYTDYTPSSCVLLVTLVRAARVLEYSSTTRVVSSFVYSSTRNSPFPVARFAGCSPLMLLSAASQYVGYTITSSQFASTSISFT